MSPFFVTIGLLASMYVTILALKSPNIRICCLSSWAIEICLLIFLYTLKEETFAIFCENRKTWIPGKILKHSIRESLFSQNILKLVIHES